MSVRQYLEEYLPAYLLQVEALKRRNWKISEKGLGDFVENTKEISELLADVLENPALLSDKDKRRISQLIPLLEGGDMEELRSLQSRCVRICLRVGQPFSRSETLSQREEEDSSQTAYERGFQEGLQHELDKVRRRESPEEALGREDASWYVLSGQKTKRDFRPQIVKECEAATELLERTRQENARKRAGLLEALADREREVSRLSVQFRGISAEEASDILVKSFQIERKKGESIRV